MSWPSETCPPHRVSCCVKARSHQCRYRFANSGEIPPPSRVPFTPRLTFLSPFRPSGKGSSPPTAGTTKRARAQWVYSAFVHTCNQTKVSGPPAAFVTIWSQCRERGSNPHGRLAHGILSPARLPISPSRQCITRPADTSESLGGVAPRQRVHFSPNGWGPSGSDRYADRDHSTEDRIRYAWSFACARKRPSRRLYGPQRSEGTRRQGQEATRRRRSDSNRCIEVLQTSPLTTWVRRRWARPSPAHPRSA